MSEYEVLIVGSGPAGIFTAYTLIDHGVEGEEICIIEKGSSSKERDSYSVEGFGGAGLFSDVKLCMRFDTGSKLPEIYFEDILNRFKRDKKFRKEILREVKFAKSSNYGQILYSLLHAKAYEPLTKTFERVKGIFSEFCERAGIEKDFYNLYKEEEHFKKYVEPILIEENLDISSYYPVIHLGSDQGRKLIEEFEKYFKEEGVELKLNTEIKSIERCGNRFEVMDSKENAYDSDILVLACGKGKSNWMVTQLKNLGVETVEDNTWIGVRVETKKSESNKLTRYVGDDPKIKWPWMRDWSDDWMIKLHCFVEGGEVISYPWENITLVGGRAESRRSEENTNFDILYSDYALTSKYVRGKLKKLEEGLKIPVVQRFEDYLNDTPTESLSDNSVKPTLKNYRTGNVRRVLSEFRKNFAEKLPTFMKKINRLYPGVADSDALIYFPVIEWGSERVKVDINMETNIRNLYAVGDGAGITQGIIAAAISGAIAGSSISRKMRK